MVLFLSLAITFFLLAAGVTSTRANKVHPAMLFCSAVLILPDQHTVFDYCV